MKILFEGQRYSLKDLHEVFSEDFDRWSIRKDKDGAELSCVGYFMNRNSNDLFFIMPKVFIFNGNKAFGILNIQKDKDGKKALSPIIDINEINVKNVQLNKWKIDVIRQLPAYIYLAIRRYRNKCKNSNNNDEADLLNQVGLVGDTEKSYLEMIFALYNFYLQHKDLFIFIYKRSHGCTQKIDWIRTVQTQMAFKNGTNIIYTEMINNMHSVNYEEDLLVIFFNTLQYIHKTYNFPLAFECYYHLMPAAQFKLIVEHGKIVRQLKEIRQNYFRDEMHELWRLLYNFYNITNVGKATENHKEYLIVRKFDRIFEDMVNDLIGDAYIDKRKALITQDDNKIVDHLFLYNAVDDLIDNGDKVYYIGDSKYYKEGHEPVGTSFFKQFTYARNIIQTEITWMISGNPDLIYRNELTEGYKITPNFFILGKVNNDYSLIKDNLELDTKFDFKSKRSYQFENRLFDRDTLFLEKYYVNFLFVIDSYIHANKYRDRKFKKKVQEKFRNNFIKLLKENYNFYLLEVLPPYTVKGAIDLHFRELNGKIYIPFNKKVAEKYFILLAYEKGKKNKEVKLINSLNNSFKVIPTFLNPLAELI